MYKFSQNSEIKLQTCHPNLQKILRRAICLCDFVVIEGRRGEEAQNLAFASGKSKLKFPHSKHNKTPSLAVDIAPYPIDWNNRERFAYLAGVIIATARELQIGLRWGGDWDKDGDLANNRFDDFVHFELT